VKRELIGYWLFRFAFRFANTPGAAVAICGAGGLYWRRCHGKPLPFWENVINPVAKGVKNIALAQDMLYLHLGFDVVAVLLQQCQNVGFGIKRFTLAKFDLFYFFFLLG